MNAPTRYASKQRDAILAAVQSFHGHPTAEAVHRILKKKYPRISLGTVYRNLNILAEDGAIGSAQDGGDGKIIFDKLLAPHHHFHCIQCGAIIDVPYIHVPSLASRVERAVHGTVVDARLEFYGVCSQCAKK